MVWGRGAKSSVENPELVVVFPRRLFRGCLIEIECYHERENLYNILPVSIRLFVFSFFRYYCISILLRSS